MEKIINSRTYTHQTQHNPPKFARKLDIVDTSYCWWAILHDDLKSEYLEKYENGAFYYHHKSYDSRNLTPISEEFQTIRDAFDELLKGSKEAIKNMLSEEDIQIFQEVIDKCEKFKETKEYQLSYSEKLVDEAIDKMIIENEGNLSKEELDALFDVKPEE